MKKSKKKLTFASVVAGTALAATLAACHATEYEPVETVYGPPMGETYEPAQEEPQDVYGPPPGATYEPAEEVIQDVYGPPINDEYDPKEEIQEDLYGPPPWESDIDLID